MPDAIGQRVAGFASGSGQHKRVRQAAFGQWRTGLRSGGAGSGDPGNDLRIDVCCKRGGQFCRSTPEDTGISRFQAHDPAALQGLPHNGRVDPVLRPAVGPDVFPGKDLFGCRPSKAQNLFLDKAIENRISLLQPLHSAQSEQIAGTFAGGTGI